MAITYFPQLNSSGIRVQRPSTAGQAHLTSLQDQASGQRFATQHRLEPLRRWTLPYQGLTDAEIAIVEAFFSAQAGRRGRWCWLDPAGNLVQYSDDFAHTSWEKLSVTVGGTAADPFGGTLARAATPGGGNPMLATAVLPEGDAAGIVLCASVYVRSASATQLGVGFVDSGFSLLAHRVWQIPAATWTRIHCPVTITGTLPVRMIIGGLSSWTTSLSLFGAMTAPLPGPGIYMRSPAAWGYRPKCRFDSDTLNIRTMGPNENALTLQIAEVGG